jgi:hypothetical protein
LGRVIALSFPVAHLLAQATPVFFGSFYLAGQLDVDSCRLAILADDGIYNLANFVERLADQGISHLRRLRQGVLLANAALVRLQIPRLAQRTRFAFRGCQRQAPFQCWQKPRDRFAAVSRVPFPKVEF